MKLSDARIVSWVTRLSDLNACTIHTPYLSSLFIQLSKPTVFDPRLGCFLQSRSVENQNLSPILWLVHKAVWDAGTVMIVSCAIPYRISSIAKVAGIARALSIPDVGKFN